MNYLCSKEGIKKTDIIFELKIGLVEHSINKENLRKIKTDTSVTSNSITI